MIIGIDVSSVPYGTGVSNYTTNLVKNLIKIDKSNTYKLFFSSLRLDLPKEISDLQSERVKIFKFKFPPTALHYLWNILHIIPIEKFIGKCDVFHTSDWTQPPSKKAKLTTTVHDLIPFIHPEWSTPKIITTHHAKMKQAIKHCSLFICVSETTQKDLLKIFPQLNPRQTIIIPEAAEEKYKKFSQLSTTVKQQKIKKIKQQYGLDRFLFVQGTREPRKNLDKIITAFSMYKDKHPGSNIELVISGKYGWGKDIVKSNGIKVLGFIPEKDLVALHASAFALIYCSLYEGFGLPVLKSLALGVPVITSKDSAMSDITKNNAILVNPNSIDEIYKAIEKIIFNSKFRGKLAINGPKIASNYSWVKTAKNTLKSVTLILC